MSSTEKKPSARKRTTSSTTVKTATVAKSAAPRTRATKSAPRKGSVPVPTHQDIERRAYEVYLREGGRGSALEHWLQAERELRRV